MLQEVFQTMVVGSDDKMITNEVGSPTLNNMNDCKHFLFIG